MTLTRWTNPTIQTKRAILVGVELLSSKCFYQDPWGYWTWLLNVEAVARALDCGLLYSTPMAVQQIKAGVDDFRVAHGQDCSGEVRYIYTVCSVGDRVSAWAQSTYPSEVIDRMSALPW